MFLESFKDGERCKSHIVGCDHSRVAPFFDLHVEDEHTLPPGARRLRVLHTPGHTRDSMTLLTGDRVFRCAM